MDWTLKAEAPSWPLGLIQFAPDFVPAWNFNQLTIVGNFQINGNLPVRATSATKMWNISAVEVPSDLVTALALVSTGFSIRQGNSTVMPQKCHNWGISVKLLGKKNPIPDTGKSSLELQV